MKTIKEIAEDIGVSRQAVYKRIKKEPLSTSLQEFLSTVDNVVYIDETGEKLIVSAFSKSEPVNDSTKFTVNQTTEVDNGLQTILAILQSELESKNKIIDHQAQQLTTKDKQLETKDKQIGEITAALENTTSALLEAQQTAQAAQALHAGTIQQQLTAGSEDGTESGQEVVTTQDEPMKKEGFFSRWFKR